MKCITVLCLSFVILGAKCGSVSFIDPCRISDNECLLKSSRKAMPYVLQGAPELGIASFNPLVLKDVNGTTGDLKLYFKDMVVSTLAQCEIIRVERSEKLKGVLEVICPITVTGHYKADGNLYVVPVEGDGEFEVKCKKVKIIVILHLKTIEKGGTKYYKIKNFDFTYEAQEKVFFNFDNLFNGDKAKAEVILSILDQSWKDVTDVIARPVINEMMTTCIQNVGKVFANVPCHELEKDD